MVKRRNRHTVIGTVSGQGYNCILGKKVSPFQEYNKISHWVDWIRTQMVLMGDFVCNDDDNKLILSMS